MKKKFIIFWNEYLVSANPRFMDEMEVLCRGNSVVYARSVNEARKNWKKAFPYCYVILCLEEENFVVK